MDESKIEIRSGGILGGCDEILNNQEMLVINKFRKISPKNRKTVIDLIKVLSESSDS